MKTKKNILQEKLKYLQPIGFLILSTKMFQIELCLCLCLYWYETGNSYIEGIGKHRRLGVGPSGGGSASHICDSRIKSWACTWLAFLGLNPTPRVFISLVRFLSLCKIDKIRAINELNNLRLEKNGQPLPSQKALNAAIAWMHFFLYLVSILTVSI